MNFFANIFIFLALPSITDENQKKLLENGLSSLYLSNNEFQEALKHSDSIPFNKIYALYRLNKFQDALDLLNQQEKKDELPYQQLKSQILYRIGAYDQSAAIYKKIIDGAKEVNEEVFTNYSAALLLEKKYDASIKATEGITEDGSSKGSIENTYELAYNAACSAIGLNQLDKAKKYLDFAAKLCRESLEGSTEEEIQDELTSILVQTAYVQQVKGLNEEAAKLYRQVIEQKPSDAVSLAVAGNNLISLEYDDDTNVVEIEKKMKLATTSKVEGKLTTWQQRGINVNQTLLLIKKKKFDECRELLQKLQKQYPESDVPSIISAAILYKEKNYDEAQKSLELFIQQKPGDAESLLRVQLSLAQLHIFRNNFDEAISLLKSLSSKFSPGIVGTVVALYQKKNNYDESVRVLSEAIEYWKSQKGAQAESNLISLLNASAQLKIKEGKIEEAIQTYKSIVELDPENKKFVAALVNVLASVDLNRAEQYAAALPDIQSSEIDVDKLERDSVRSLNDISVSKIDLRAGESQLKKKSRKKKKNPQPKNFDPTKKPDPERWLPKKERAAYKKLHGESRGHQGSSIIKPSPVLEVKGQKGQKTLLSKAGARKH